MPISERRYGDRRAIVERRKNQRELINEFIGDYGPDRRLQARRRESTERRQERSAQHSL